MNQLVGRHQPQPALLKQGLESINTANLPVKLRKRAHAPQLRQGVDLP